jgi:DNA-binding NarL/FixJ family response regulator
MAQVIIQVSLLSDSQEVNLLTQFLKKEDISFREREATALPPKKAINIKNLGKRGLNVLNFLSLGFTYAEIAEKLKITIDGVRYYVKKIYKVLGVSNSAEAVSYYVRHLG